MTREQAIDEATKVWRRADITTGGSIIQILEKLGLVRFRASSRCRPRVTPCRTYKLTVTVELIDGGKLRRGGHLPRGGRLTFVNIERQAHALRATRSGGCGTSPSRAARSGRG
jgi:hypothetical protein